MRSARRIDGGIARVRATAADERFPGEQRERVGAPRVDPLGHGPRGCLRRRLRGDVRVRIARLERAAGVEPFDGDGERLEQKRALLRRQPRVHDERAVIGVVVDEAATGESGVRVDRLAALRAAQRST